ncbi:MAG: heliorhodopsin HeR [Aggregatilineales bacterium]
MLTVFIGENKYRNLRRFNIIAGIAHAIQVVLMLILANDQTFPITTAFLEFNESTQTLLPAQDTLFDLPLVYLVASFSALSAIAHFIIAFPAYDWYVKSLEKRRNPARWIEYAFSSSIMIVVIAILFGVYNIATLVAIVGSNAAMNLFGWDMELLNDQQSDRINWKPFIFGSIIGLIPWITLGIYFVGTINGNQVPAFVFTIFIVVFLSFNIFAVNMWLQYKKIGPWKHYLFGEAAFIILSLVAKSLLAWQVYGGALNQPV